MADAPHQPVSHGAGTLAGMDWYRITCWRCRGDFMDPSPGGSHCIWCAAPCLHERGGHFVGHASEPVGPLPEPPLPPPLQPLPIPPAPAWDEDGALRIYQWRLRSSTGKLYITKHKMSEQTAKRMDPNAVPVGAPDIIRSGNQASTSDFMGRAPVSTPPPQAGMESAAAHQLLSGWRDGSQHQWSRDPGRGRRYR